MPPLTPPKYLLRETDRRLCRARASGGTRGHPHRQRRRRRRRGKTPLSPFPFFWGAGRTLSSDNFPLFPPLPASPPQAPAAPRPRGPPSSASSSTTASPAGGAAACRARSPCSACAACPPPSPRQQRQPPGPPPPAPRSSSLRRTPSSPCTPTCAWARLGGAAGGAQPSHPPRSTQGPSGPPGGCASWSRTAPSPSTWPPASRRCNWVVAGGGSPTPTSPGGGDPLVLGGDGGVLSGKGDTSLSFGLVSFWLLFFLLVFTEIKENRNKGRRWVSVGGPHAGVSPPQEQRTGMSPMSPTGAGTEGVTSGARNSPQPSHPPSPPALSSPKRSLGASKPPPPAGCTYRVSRCPPHQRQTLNPASPPRRERCSSPCAPHPRGGALRPAAPSPSQLTPPRHPDSCRFRVTVTFNGIWGTMRGNVGGGSWHPQGGGGE